MNELLEQNLCGAPWAEYDRPFFMRRLSLAEIAEGLFKREIVVWEDGHLTLAMGANVKLAFGTEAQAITCTMASLASSATAGREGTAIDNTSNLYLDALVMLVVALQAGTPANDKAVYVYGAGTVDAATPQWPDAFTGTDAAITFNSPANARLLGTVYAPTSAGTFKGGPWSMASLHGGTLPEKWSIAVQNYTGIALHATEGNHKKLFQGVYATST